MLARYSSHTFALAALDAGEEEGATDGLVRYELMAREAPREVDRDPDVHAIAKRPDGGAIREAGNQRQAARGGRSPRRVEEVLPRTPA